MTKETPQTGNFDSAFILDALLKYRKHLIIITIASIAASVLFSSELFMKPKFKSTAIVYPSNLIPYSTESPTEQMLQLFESDDIRDQLIMDFNLMSHYEIDSTQKYPLSLLHLQMAENIKIDKTKFESVEIEVWDSDPKVAKALADSILAKFDKKVRNIQRQKTGEVVVIFKNQMDLKKAEMDSMEAELKSIREKYDIMDFENQVKSFSRVYYEAMVDGKAGSGGNRPIDKTLNNILSKGGEYVSLKEHLWRVRGTYNDLKIKYEDLLKDLTKELTYSSVVTSPVVAEKKSYPVRSLIVVMFTGSMLLLASFVIVFIENRKRVS
jgi:uncharacterized protein involved in exopolysaccharide biosynthesis